MKKTATLLLISLLISTFTMAQDSIKNWTHAFSAGLNFSQAAFSDNWTGGGVNSLAFSTFANGKANYATQKKITWDNEFQLAYGILQNQGQEDRKSVDKIFVDSRLGYKIAAKWNLFASINFSSQFKDGFKYEKVSGVETTTYVSNFMSPGYLTSSLGIEYKPVDYFWFRFGTGTLRQTFVLDKNLYKTVPNNYGVDTGQIVKNEIALQLVASFDRDIAKNMNLKARAMALAPYNNFGKITSQLDVTLRAKVNKFINVSISGLLLNDIDQAPDVQYSQGFSLGIMYMFTEFK